MSGKARGRARGRARGGAQDMPEPTQRPGPSPPQAAQAAQSEGAQAMPGSGRASQRGGMRPEPRPGASVNQAQSQMAALSMGGDQRGAGRGERRSFFEDPHTRPDDFDKRGTSGNKVALVSNYFKLERGAEFHIYQYRVDYNPDIQNKAMRQMMLKEHRELLGKTRAFDGQTLFLPARLEQKVTEVFSTRRSDGEKIKISIMLTNEIPPTSPMCLHLYNIIFRRVLNMIDMKQIGRHYYSPEQGAVIPQHKMEVWPGFITSILQYESSTMLMADISHKLLRRCSILDDMYDWYSQIRGGDFHSICTRKLVGSIALTRYNNKTYRIDDIDWDNNPSSKFALHNGTEISYKEYYKKTHDIDVKDPDQPLLLSLPKKSDIRRGQDKPIFLLPELCTLTGLSTEMKEDRNVMKDIAVHTRVAPDARFATLTGFIKRINGNEQVQNEISGWNMRFSTSLLEMNGRQLPSEKIIQANTNYSSGDADWSGKLRTGKLLSCVALRAEQWVVVFTQRDQPKAKDFVQTMSRVGPPMGIQVGQPAMCVLRDDNTQSYLTALKQYINGSTQMVVCVLPSNRKDRYDAIKTLCCVDMPIPSQVVLSRNLGGAPGKLMSVITKIAIQLNCKLGGEVWALEIPLNGMMVVGLDTYHDSAKKGRSVAGFVASLNKSCTRYYSQCRFQTTTQELHHGLTTSLTAAMKEYHRINSSLPDRIVIYRDGVGDGQLDMVTREEIPQLQACFAQIGADYNPKLTVIVVKKRINTRFFARGRQGLNNPQAGTIVDTEVTKPDFYDFFLVSQSVRQGTVSPCHYNVVHDQSGLKPDHLQKLTYKLCHLYYNWPGTIRVPAPCQYAHKLAFLVGQSLHKDPSMELANKLYYL